MGKLIAVVGNVGAGKTTLVARLREVAGFVPLLEEPEARPFQQAFARDRKRWALANQLDFYVAWAEQERLARGSDGIYIMDGGLDQDHRVFSRYFREQEELNESEYALCERTYRVLRQSLPPPDVVVRVDAPVKSVSRRRRERGRVTDSEGHALVRDQDLARFEALFDEWLRTVDAIRFPSESVADFDRPRVKRLVEMILAQITE